MLIQLKKEADSFLLNGDSTFVGQALKAGDLLTVRICERESSPGILPVELPLFIIYEDEDLLILNKPSDMPIHPSIHNHENTLANALMWYFQNQNQPFVFRCINRLDRDTTGLLVVAKHMLSAAVLSEQSKHRQIGREYLAVVSGEVPGEGTIEAPIARKEGSMVERCVDFERGDRAVTHFRRLAYENGYSLVSLKLETGRTHQIRIHMRYLGYPVVGDYLYNPDYSLTEHQALHSWHLSFTHPITGKQMYFEAPPPWLSKLGLTEPWLESL